MPPEPLAVLLVVAIVTWGVWAAVRRRDDRCPECGRKIDPERED